LLFKLLVVCVLLWLVWRFFRSARGEMNGNQSKMVQDPECHAFLPEGYGHRVQIEGEIVHFCSTACRDAYLKRAGCKVRGSK